MFLKQPGLFKEHRRWEKGAFSVLQVGWDFCWEASQEESGECLALVVVFLLMRHLSRKCLFGEKTALMFNVFYFNPGTVFGIWEFGTWIRLTAGNY